MMTDAEQEAAITVDGVLRFLARVEMFGATHAVVVSTLLKRAMDGADDDEQSVIEAALSFTNYITIEGFR